MSLQVLPYGSDCLLLRSALPRGLESARRMAQLAQAVCAVEWVREAVAGWNELACFLQPPADPGDEALSQHLADRAAQTLQQPLPALAGREHHIPVRYHGPDLAAVAQALAMSPADVVAAHQACPCTVGVMGFRPYFAYCLGLSPALRLPRKAQPSMLAAGAVAMVEDMSAIYPSDGPGGWHVLGHTDPACCRQLQLGDVLHFVEQAS